MIIKIIFRNLFYKPSRAVLSMVLLMFGTGIISMLLLLNYQVEHKFNNDLRDIDLVVGAKGSPLQLVLSAVYHVDAPTGNIRLAEAEQLLKHPFVGKAVPLAFGDSYNTFRIVGTDTGYLDLYGATLQQGVVFNNALDAVLGAEVARATGLKIGDTFAGTHGMGVTGHVHEAFRYKVTGMLAPTHTVADHLILTTIATVWKIHAHYPDEEEGATHKGHTAEHQQETPAYDPEVPHEHHPEEEITALLIKFRSPMGLIALPRMISETTNMQAVSPVLEMKRLLGLLGIGITTMQAIALAIMLIAGLSILTALYSRLMERKYELALARAMGGSRLQLFIMILSEGMLLVIMGFIGGIVLGRAGLLLLEQWSGSTMHFPLFYSGFIREEFYLLLITVGIGFLSALLPALQAFRINISKTLAHA